MEADSNRGLTYSDTEAPGTAPSTLVPRFAGVSGAFEKVSWPHLAREIGQGQTRPLVPHWVSPAFSLVFSAFSLGLRTL